MATRKRGRPPKLDRNQAMIHMAREGASVKEIAERFGVSRARVYQIVPPEMREDRSPQAQGLTEVQKRVRDMVHEGMSQADIAREMGVSGARVYEVVKRLRELGEVPAEV